jgi:hypothetical protein
MTCLEAERNLLRVALAAGAKREGIEQGCADLGVNVWEVYIPLVPSAMKEMAAELALDGSSATSNIG